MTTGKCNQRYLRKGFKNDLGFYNLTKSIPERSPDAGVSSDDRHNLCPCKGK